MLRLGARPGFTLVELLVVVALAGVVVRFGVPTLIAARTRSRYETCLTNLKLIDLAKNKLAKHKGISKVYLVKDAKDLVPHYLPSWPAGPVEGKYSAGKIGEPATFLGHGTKWFVKHCGNDHYDGECPL